MGIEDLERKLKIAREAIDLEMSEAETEHASKKNSETATRVSNLQAVAGFADYLLGEGDPAGIEVMVKKGRQRILEAKMLIENSPTLANLPNEGGER